ncbi:MAG: hypothetical protein JXR40_07355, partial [Pontiellaceae bacterium]|nr:hypothetical protein [Pontiellaceae bacterium]
EAEERWLHASNKQREKAEYKLEIITLVERIIQGGAKVDAAVSEAAMQFECSASKHLQVAEENGGKAAYSSSILSVGRLWRRSREDRTQREPLGIHPCRLFET